MVVVAVDRGGSEIGAEATTAQGGAETTVAAGITAVGAGMEVTVEGTEEGDMDEMVVVGATGNNRKDPNTINMPPSPPCRLLVTGTLTVFHV